MKLERVLRKKLGIVTKEKFKNITVELSIFYFEIGRICWFKSYYLSLKGGILSELFISNQTEQILCMSTIPVSLKTNMGGTMIFFLNIKFLKLHDLLLQRTYGLILES